MTEQAPAAALSGSDFYENVRTVQIKQNEMGYGMRVTSQPNVPGIVITSITPGGVADRGRLRVGDVIIEVWPMINHG